MPEKNTLKISPRKWTDRDIHTKTGKQRQTLTDRYRQLETETDRQRQTYLDKHIATHTGRQAGKHVERQKDSFGVFLAQELGFQSLEGGSPKCCTS